MSDLTSPKIIKLKGILFLLLGFLSSALLIVNVFSLKNIVLLLIAIWSFCRFYYFAFYVIERYVDPKFKFSGLWDFAKFLIRGQSEH
jgi:hypothetical protein